MVELPYEEGRSGNAGIVIARVDDLDHRQQVAIIQAALEVQRRQLATAEQKPAAAQKIVESDTADLDLPVADGFTALS
jgi:multidrug resistance efflux pump